MDLIARLDLLDALVEERRAAIVSHSRPLPESDDRPVSVHPARPGLVERLSVLYGVRRDRAADCNTCV